MPDKQYFRFWNSIMFYVVTALCLQNFPVNHMHKRFTSTILLVLHANRIVGVLRKFCVPFSTHKHTDNHSQLKYRTESVSSTFNYISALYHAPQTIQNKFTQCTNYHINLTHTKIVELARATEFGIRNWLWMKMIGIFFRGFIDSRLGLIDNNNDIQCRWIWLTTTKSMWIQLCWVNKHWKL